MQRGWYRMGRPREFDNGVALDAAIRCFWSRGFEATSMRDLSSAMGICGTSLYNAFGDKRSLFEQALERYLESTTRQRIRRLEATLPPKARVPAFIAEIIERSLNDRERRGCFLINSALEVAPHDHELGEIIGLRLGEIEEFFFRSLSAARASGDLPAPRDPRDLARLMLGVLLGIRVLARAKPDRALLEGVARPALALLD